MREKHLAARTRRRFRKTTDSKHSFPIAPNLRERDFTASGPDKVWVTDTTFLWTTQGWLYLAVILNLFSRRVVGWATSRNVDRHLALAALDMALTHRRPAAGLCTTRIKAAPTPAATTARPSSPRNRMQHEPAGRLL